MLKKAAILAIVAVLVTGLGGTGLAAGGKTTGKITKIDGQRVTVVLEGAKPEWLKAGTKVMAAGGAPLVLKAAETELTLRFGKEKAEQLKVDQVLQIEETSGPPPQGC